MFPRLMQTSFRSLILCVASMVTPLALLPAQTYRGPGGAGDEYEVQIQGDELAVTVNGPDLKEATLFFATGRPDGGGSALVPFGKSREGSTVFLPFRASDILMIEPDGAFLRKWDRTQWGGREPAGEDTRVTRSASSIRVVVGGSLARNAREGALFAYVKNFDTPWGAVRGSIDPMGPTGEGDIVFRRFLAADDAGSLGLVSRGGAQRPRIYQMLPRLFGNTNATRKPNGFIEENGCGKFADLDASVLAQLKAMGFTHIWPTGVLQQATATDYSSIGEPADDPDLLKGLAGSPYAIKDYYDVSPDYARNPAERLQEFRDMVKRIHAAGMKVLIDFVPNHVARSYRSTVRPDLSFGANDQKDRYFHPDNNFFWLTPEARPFGKGPPLRLPTVDADGNPISPTARVAKAPSDGLFDAEREHGRVTGSNLASWEPDEGSWYETVKLNYGYDFLDESKSTRAYPHGDRRDLPIPDTWHKMAEIIQYWQGIGVDGFRVDMAHLVPPEFWRWLIERARGRNEQVFFVAEAYDSDPAKVPSGDPLLQEVGRGNVMFDLLDAGYDAVYDDATYDKLKEIYTSGAWANDLDRIAAHPFVFDNSLRYAENHDEVRLAAAGEWGGLGAEVGRPVTALLAGLSRGPVMLYHGQEVGEPAADVEGFGQDDARTSIFDYWSMPEFTKWVNDGAYDGGRLSNEQKSLRAFYSRLMNVAGDPAFRDGEFIPLNPANTKNPRYGRLPGETASGHWLYSFVRRDPQTGQTIMVVVNLHPSERLENVAVRLDERASAALPQAALLRVTDRLSDEAPRTLRRTENTLELGALQPLTAYYFEIIDTEQ